MFGLHVLRRASMSSSALKESNRFVSSCAKLLVLSSFVTSWGRRFGLAAKPAANSAWLIFGRLWAWHPTRTGREGTTKRAKSISEESRDIEIIMKSS